MDPVRPAVLGIDIADFAGKNKMRALVNEEIPVGRFQFGLELLEP